MKTIKIYNVNHAVEVIFENNLEDEFEIEFGLIEDGESFNDLIKREQLTLRQMVTFLNQNSDNEEYIIEQHWLEILMDENNLSGYKLAKQSNLHHSVIYRMIERDSKIENINLSTAYALAKGLGIDIQTFVTDVYNRFKEGETMRIEVKTIHHNNGETSKFRVEKIDKHTTDFIRIAKGKVKK